MIEGLTHDQGILHKVTKYKGKISTGFAPGEGPNKGNYPSAAGFFRMLKEVTKTERVGASEKTVAIKEWVLNQEVQDKVEKALPNPNKTPRRVEIVSLFKDVDDMWESSLAMYSGSDGLLCKSHGYNTNARYLTYDSEGERQWIDREFNGVSGCQFKGCPDYKAGKCKGIGLLKCFPVVDMSPNPYRFETRSINTIIGIESALDDLRMLLMAGHAVRQLEAGKQLPFDGFFGAKLYLVHKKIKSGGKDVFVTDLLPTPEFSETIMEPIRRGLERKQSQSKMVGAAGSISMLEQASQKLLASAEDAEEVDLDAEDEKAIAVNFGANADSPPLTITDTPAAAATAILLNEDGKSPGKK